MKNVVAAFALDKLDALRNELMDLAVDLDRRKRPDAADVAMTTAAKISELCDELTGMATGLAEERN